MCVPYKLTNHVADFRQTALYVMSLGATSLLSQFRTIRHTKMAVVLSYETRALLRSREDFEILSA
jgi:hypothetical protein